VDALLIGTGGDRGWPEEGCSCASCLRAAAAGIRRAPGQVVVDGQLLLVPGAPPQPANGNPPQPGNGSSAYSVLEVTGGWDITGPDGGRLLAAAGPGAIPEPPEGTAGFDTVLLDLLASPGQLGLLRARGLVTDQTRVAALYTDHRISSEQEMARRCALWGATAGQDGQVIGASAPEAQRASATRPHRTLILGGARSGKSREAELRLLGEPAVTYLAAGPWADDQSADHHWADDQAADHHWADDQRADDQRADDQRAGGQSAEWRGADGEPDIEWAERVAAHRAARPPWWRTVESLDVAGVLRREKGALLIDGIGTWLAGVMDQAGAWPDDGAAWAPPAAADPQHLISARIEELIEAWRQTRALVVAVTDEVGSGLVPPYPAGRMFRDQLGWLNQRLAGESDVTVLVVAGRSVILPA
jgi:adenosylcobinamide kinase / adenosylcobinamide-phosphate guanylyltransferase